MISIPKAEFLRKTLLRPRETGGTRTTLRGAATEAAVTIAVFGAGKLVDAGVRHLQRRQERNPGPRATGYPEGKMLMDSAI